MENLLRIIKGRRPPGILIVGWRDRLLYSNREALGALSCPKPDEKRGGKKRPVIPAEILELCQRLKKASLVDATPGLPKIETDCTLMFDGEKRHFSVRAFLIDGYGRKRAEPHIMLLLEKVTSQRMIDFDRIRTEYLLSSREMDVIRQVSQDFSNRVIAENLFISPHTVKDHLKKIMEKMKVDSRGEIVALLK